MSNVKYPETTMSSQQLIEAARGPGDCYLTRVANKVIQHAIDNQQVVSVDVLKKMAISMAKQGGGPGGHPLVQDEIDAISKSIFERAINGEL